MNCQLLIFLSWVLPDCERVPAAGAGAAAVAGEAPLVHLPLPPLCTGGR